MVEYETIGETKTLLLSSGRFIEIAKKNAISEKGTNQFFMIAQGEFYLDLNNKNAKRYIKNISIPVKNISEVIEAFKSLQ